MKKFSNEWWASLPPEKVGKATEVIIEELFALWNKSQLFAWHRMPDAKAARGRLKAQPADFLYRNGKSSGFLEVKALKHAHRLPSARVTQLPTLLKWSMAGSGDLILIHHYMEGVWRAVKAADLDPSVPSWDLRNVRTFPSAEMALLNTGWF